MAAGYIKNVAFLYTHDAEDQLGYILSIDSLRRQELLAGATQLYKLLDTRGALTTSINFYDLFFDEHDPGSLKRLKTDAARAIDSAQVAFYEATIEGVLENNSPVWIAEAPISFNGRYCGVKGLVIPRSVSITPELDYLIQLILLNGNLDFAHTYGTPSWGNGANIDSTVSQIVSLFDQRLRCKPQGDQWGISGSEYFSKTVRFFVEKSLPIHFVLPAFPCKSSNMSTKVHGRLPDLGEELAFGTMNSFASSIQEIYPPGAVMGIVSDGHVFSDLIGVDDDRVVEYGNKLQEMASYLNPSASARFPFRGLDSLLGNTTDDGNVPESSVLALKLPSIKEVAVTHHIRTAISYQADEARQMLELLCGTGQEEIRRQVKQDSEVTRLFRGFSKFLMEDLVCHPDIANLPSKSAKKNLCSKLAYDMIGRNQAYSTLVAVLMPFHVRLSIHPHPNTGPKFGVNLIPARILYGHQTLKTELDLFHIPTPWHNAVIRDSEGAYMLTKKYKIERLISENPENNISESFYPDGRFSHYQADTQFDKLNGLSGDGTQSEPSPTSSFDQDSRESGATTESSDVNTKAATSVAVAVDLPAANSSADGQPKPATRAPPPPKYSIARRRFFLGLVALAGFLGPLAGNIYLPAMEPIRIELGVSVLLINLTVSLFMLTFALAPLGWSSAADLFGRRTIYIASLPIFIVSSIALAFTQSYPTLLVFRIFQGVGAAAVQSVGAGTIADLFPPLERGRAMSMFLLGPQLGPLVGPVIGGAVARYLGWRAVFVVLACLGGVVWAAIALFLPETLRKKLERMEEYPADKVIVLRFSRATREIRDPGTSGSSEILLPRYNPLAPLKMLSRRSILLCLIAVAIMFGSFYCVTVEVPVVFSTLFAFNELGVGLAYVALGLGFIIGSTAGGKVSDQMLKARMKAMGLTNAKDVPPEIRVRSQVVGLILFPIGLISFGITAYFAVHPAFVLVALFICGFGMTWTFTCNTTYLVDSFPGAAASVVALNSLFRNPAAAIGSAIIEPLVTAASYAGAFGIIGGCTVAASGLMVIVMVHGAKWRPNPAVPSA